MNCRVGSPARPFISTMMNLNTRHTLQAPQGTIGVAGSEAVNGLIYRQHVDGNNDWQRLNPDYLKHYIPPLPEDWPWVWLVKSGQYRGTMPTRVRSYYHKNHNLKCPPGFLAEVGNIARQHTEDNACYDFEFTDCFDWQPGDFGDSGSCFWGDREHAREIMRDNGALAVRFYADGKGQGRAWFYTLRQDLHLVWNGYGFKPNATLTIARVLALHFSASYKRIALHASDLLYINGNLGYLVGSPADIANRQSLTLDWRSDRCSSCGDSINEDDIYVGPNGETYCDRCFYRRFDTCHHCGDAFAHDELIFIEGYDIDLCDRCLTSNYRLCQDCDRWHHPADLETVEGKHYCLNCLSYNQPQ